MIIRRVAQLLSALFADRDGRFDGKRFRPKLDHLEDRLAPATFHVTTRLDVVDPNDRVLSLREAITRANETPGADLINLKAGVYRISIAGANEDNNATGDFDITDTLTICGVGRSLTIIDGNQLDRVFEVIGSSSNTTRLVLKNLTVRGGSILDNGGGIRPYGGGIRAYNANLVLHNVNVTGNQADIGGGIIADSVTLINSIVRENKAYWSGGGIEANTVTLTNSIVWGNVATYDGGGIRADVMLKLENSTVSRNMSVLGSGGGIQATTATLINSTVRANLADGFGGGIHSGSGPVTLITSTVSGNLANDKGGGISAGSVTVRSSTINGNSAGGNAGGISAYEFNPH
jgi:hypothetical protein